VGGREKFSLSFRPTSSSLLSSTRRDPHAKHQIAFEYLALPRLLQLTHEFVTKFLTVKLELNGLLERLLYLGSAPNHSDPPTAPLSSHFLTEVFMSATAPLSKLAELRAKTDEDLVSIIDNALEAGLLLAANESDVDPAGVLHRRAADICADTVMLVEKVENVGERRRLEEKLRQLRNALDRRLQVQTACS